MNENLIVAYHNIPYNDNWLATIQEWRPRLDAEIERLNDLLREQFPTLRARLREQHGETLDAWLASPSCDKVAVNETSDPYSTPFVDDDDLNESACELFYLDMEGYDGFHPAKPLTAKDCAEIRNHIFTLAKDRVRSNGLKALINEIQSGYYDSRPSDKSDGVFFVWAAMIESGQSGEVGSLWILEHQAMPDDHDYMFLIEDGASLNQAWRLCIDVLPPEIPSILDLEYV